MEFLRTRFFSFSIRIILLLIIVNLLWLIRPVVYEFVAILKEIMVPFIVGLLIAYLLHPIVASLEKRKVPRLVAVLLIYAIFILVVVIGLINAIPVFTSQFAELADDLPRLTEWYKTWMSEWEYHKYFLPDSIQLGVDRVIVQSQERISVGIAQLVNQAKSMIGKLIAFAVVPFIAFYLLKDMKDVHTACVAVIPHKYRKNTLIILREANDSLGKYIHGQMVVALLVGAFTYLGYWLIGMPYPFILAALICVTNVIPYIGPLIGAIPSVVIALTISTKMLLFVLIVNLVIQMVEGNILSPNIVGRSLHLHPLSIIFALLAGEAIAGIIGMIIAIPALAVFKVVINRITLIMRES